MSILDRLFSGRNTITTTPPPGPPDRQALTALVGGSGGGERQIVVRQEHATARPWGMLMHDMALLYSESSEYFSLAQEEADRRAHRAAQVAQRIMRGSRR